MRSYKVLVVDDEAYARSLVAKFLKASDGKYILAQECSNGKNALEEIKKGDIDIVICDIKMPNMDGMELLAKSRGLDLETAFIMLTAYGEYDMVRECFLLGAYDYIIKSDIKQAEFLEIMDRVSEKLMRKKSDTNRKEELSKVTQQLIGNKMMSKTLIQKAEGLGIYVKPGQLGILDIKIYGFAEFIKEKWDNDEMLFSYGINNIIDELCEKSGFLCSGYYKYDGEFVLLIAGATQDEDMNVFVKVFCKGFLDALEFFDSINVAFGASFFDKDTATVNDLYFMAVNAREMNFLSNGELYVKYSGSQVKNTNLTNLDYAEGMLTACRKKNFKDVVDFSPIDINVSSEEFNICNAEHLKKFFDRWYYALSDLKYEPEENESFLCEFKKFETALKNGENLKTVLEYFNQTVQTLYEKENTEHAVVKLIKKKIAENYKEGVFLPEIAEEINMNKKYIGRIFKKNTGKSYNEYFMEYRIKKAVELIQNSNMNVSELSEEVGFSDVSSFSRAFKLITGKSPKSYINTMR